MLAPLLQIVTICQFYVCCARCNVIALCFVLSFHIVVWCVGHCFIFRLRVSAVSGLHTCTVFFLLCLTYIKFYVCVMSAKSCFSCFFLPLNMNSVKFCCVLMQCVNVCVGVFIIFII